MDFVAEIDTNHNGYFEYFLCDLDSCGESDIHGKCFKNGHCYKLDRVPHPDCQDPNQNTHYECGPIDDKYPGRWYLPCRNTGHVGVHIVGGPSGTMRYRLPKGVKCKHCVIQWYWATANSCAPRGLLEYMARLGNPFGTTCESDGGGRGTFRHGMTQCGGEAVPEEFWSCADVQISDDGKPAGAVAAVGEPMSSPIPSDEDKLKKNPDEVLKKAGEELKKDIQEEVAGAQDELTKEQIAAKKGLCLLEGEKCDGSVRCCDWQQVCVYGMLSSSFTCRFWWALWEEAELMQKTGYHMPPDGDVGDGDMTIVTSTTTEPLPPAAEVTQAMVPAVVPPSPSYSPSPMHNNPGAYNQQAMAGMPQQPQPPAVPSPSMQPSYYKAPVQNPQATSTQQPAKKKCGPKCQKWYEYLRWKRWLRIKAKLDLQKKQRNRRKRWAAKKKNRRKNSWRRRNSGRGKKWRKVKGRRNNKGRSYRKRHPWWTRRRWNKSGRRSKWHRRRW